ncbi:MAG TPA: mercury resistance system transport protein MerF [Nitrospiraceae bacterium]|nr:mercury resistance system transport protein MerF [Nitrospiraceae bacterium]
MWTCSGIVGALVASLCCFTPVAVLGLSVAGLGFLTGYIDYLALPLFAVSMGLIGYGLFRRTCCRNSRNLTKSL